MYTHTMSMNVYSVSGTYMGEKVDKNRLPKGVNIINGKKQIVK